MTDDVAPIRRSSRGQILLLGAAIAGIALLAVAVARVTSAPERQHVTGVVVAVESTGLTAVQGFSLRDELGRTIQFRIGRLENPTQFAPGHLAEHKVTLSPILVTYVQEPDGTLTAVKLEDWPQPGFSQAPPPS